MRRRGARGRSNAGEERGDGERTSAAPEALEAMEFPVTVAPPAEDEELVEEIRTAFEAPVVGARTTWQPSTLGWVARRGLMALIFIGILIAPLFVNQVQDDLISLAFIYVVIGLSINILMGYAGQISLGHQAFVGVGAFTSAYMVSTAHLTFWIAFLVAGLSGAAAALVLGFIALRLKGLFLALITLAYGSVARLTIFNLPSLTGGGAGARAPRPPGFDSHTNKPYVYLCLMVLVALMYIDWRFIRSKVGRAIQAIRENELAAASFGINVTAYKLIAFVASGVFAGLGGSLYAHQQTSVSAGNFDFTLALTFVLMVVVGGLNSRVGVFIGSAFFALFKPVLATISVTASLYSGLIGAVLLLLTLTGFPGGIAQQIAPLLRWFRGGRLSEGHRTQLVQAGGAGVRP